MQRAALTAYPQSYSVSRGLKKGYISAINRCTWLGNEIFAFFPINQCDSFHTQDNSDIVAEHVLWSCCQCHFGGQLDRPCTRFLESCKDTCRSVV